MTYYEVLIGLAWLVIAIAIAKHIWCGGSFINISMKGEEKEKEND